MTKCRHSPLFQRIAQWLEANPEWRGTYGELATRVGYDPVKCSRAVGTVIKAYKIKHPGFDNQRVFRKSTGRPGYER
jgi:hypothetical protein